MQHIASSPHRAGSEQNRKVGDYLLTALAQAGLKTSFKEYQATLHDPVEARLELMTGENREEMQLCEKYLPEDPYTKIAPEELPFFAFSPDANLEAPVVFANFGTRDDYAFLKKQGISVAGKIVLLRAQGICRGMKSMIAEEEGAAALLLYPELKDQGFVKPSYPAGPHLPPWTLMRGTMTRYFIQPGDPYRQASPLKESLLPKIPSLPISEETAKRIFSKLSGPPAPESWRGFMKVPYTLGGASLRARFVYRGQNSTKTIRNIFGYLPGTTDAAGTVLVGAHYDAWIYGAADPSSGAASVLETARILSEAGKKGFPPRRNVLFAFWDGEEYGMFGSSRWVEEEAPGKQVYAYINVDTAVSAHEFVGSVMPGLRGSLEEVLEKVEDPLSGKLFSEIRPQFEMPAFSRDTTAFLGMTAIPVADIGFGRWYSVYHSLYDDLNWYNRFNDPGYRYTATLVKILSLFVHQLSSREVFPYRFSEVGEYLRDNIHASGELQKEINEFTAAARKWESRQTGPDSTLLEASRAFLADSGPFGRNLLVRPSSTEGCAAITPNGEARLIQALIRARRILSE